MSCQICVEVCPFDAIKMDVEYDYPTEDRFAALLFNKHQLAKSNDYYHEIHPTEAAAVDAALAAERESAAAKAAATAAAAAKTAAAKVSAESRAVKASPDSAVESITEPPLSGGDGL